VAKGAARAVAWLLAAPGSATTDARRSPASSQWAWSSAAASTSARSLSSYSSGRDNVVGLSLSDGFAAYGISGLRKIAADGMREHKMWLENIARDHLTLDHIPRNNTTAGGETHGLPGPTPGISISKPTSIPSTQQPHFGTRTRTRLGDLSTIASENKIQSQIVFSAAGALPCGAEGCPEPDNVAAAAAWLKGIFEDPSAVVEQMMAMFGDDPIPADAGARALFPGGMDQLARGVGESKKASRRAFLPLGTGFSSRRHLLPKTRTRGLLPMIPVPRSPSAVGSIGMPTTGPAVGIKDASEKGHAHIAAQSGSRSEAGPRTGTGLEVRGENGRQNLEPPFLGVNQDF